ncbi:hypothetical protein L226DRAFT_466872, partial [Lentinus tigrinus ALCF2SS1-7]
MSIVLPERVLLIFRELRISVGNSACLSPYICPRRDFLVCCRSSSSSNNLSNITSSISPPLPHVLAMSSISTSTKRRRDTQTAGTPGPPSSQPHDPAATTQARPPAKRRKEGDASNAPTDDGEGGETTEPEADPDGEAEATDGGVPALSARVRRSTKTRLLSGEQKRARFLDKYAGMTPEQILDRVSKGWRSRVYEHYQRPRIIRGPQGVIVHRFICKRYPSKHVDRSDYEDSTGNLKRHADSCDPDETPESESITAFA